MQLVVGARRARSFARARQPRLPFCCFVAAHALRYIARTRARAPLPYARARDVVRGARAQHILVVTRGAHSAYARRRCARAYHALLALVRAACALYRAALPRVNARVAYAMAAQRACRAAFARCVRVRARSFARSAYGARVTWLRWRDMRARMHARDARAPRAARALPLRAYARVRAARRAQTDQSDGFNNQFFCTVQTSVLTCLTH